jgi:monolysocardiolipin acyltransferase
MSAPSQPSLPWRTASSLIMGTVASLSRAFLFSLNNVEVLGLERFLNVLDKRADVESRNRGLITGILSGFQRTDCMLIYS